MTALHKLYTDPYWYTYIPSPAEFGGLSSLLATKFDSNLTNMVSNDTVPLEAARIRRRIFSEVIYSALGKIDIAEQQSIQGDTLLVKRRVLVNFETAITICVTLWTSSFLLVLIAWLSSPRNRPLGVISDPGTIVGAASLIASSSTELQTAFQDIDPLGQTVLGNSNYYNHRGTINNVHIRTHPKSSQKGKTPWFKGFYCRNKIACSSHEDKTSAYRLRYILSMLFLFVFVLVAIGVMKKFATSSRLDQTLSVYQASVKVAGRLGAFAPFSVFPTLIAITVGLWWDSVDSALRFHQPLISMKAASTQASRGLAITYQSSYWVWAALKASLNGHWLLALVTLGSFLAQVCKSLRRLCCITPVLT
jgi:hypothetical protein